MKNPLVEVAEHQIFGGSSGWTVTITAADGSELLRPMAAFVDDDQWWPMPDQSLPPAPGGSWQRPGPDLAVLAGVIERGIATVAQMQDYGRHLFDSLLGQEGWAHIRKGAGSGLPIEVGLRWDCAPLHRLIWELLHDGTEYLTLRRAEPVVLLRLSRLVGSDPIPLDRAPRILFAVGNELDDDSVRAGDEVMGILRGVERPGSDRGSASTRVLTSASLAGLGQECRRWRPDVVHLVGHGRCDPISGIATLTLTGDTGTGTQDCTAAMLAAELIPEGVDSAHRPMLVVISACDGAKAVLAAGTPLAAELVESGLPIVLAMAGEISDQACRVFSRSVVVAVAKGAPFTTAIAQGRHAAFVYSGSAPQKTDWALPAVFSSSSLDSAFRLADPATMYAVRDVIAKYRAARQPLFAGRHELMRDLDDLLADSEPGVLLLHSPTNNAVGGSRALQELAAEAIRLGHLPVDIGPFVVGDAPSSLEAVFLALGARLVAIGRVLGISEIDLPRRTMDLIAGTTPQSADIGHLLDLMDPIEPKPLLAQRGADGLVVALRADTVDLRDRLVAAYPRVFVPGASVLLLLDDIHLYDETLVRLKRLLRTSGLGDAATKLPVIMFGKESEAAGIELQAWRKQLPDGSIRPKPLLQFNQLPADIERLACLTWLLNPSPAAQPDRSTVLAPVGRNWFDAVFSTAIVEHYETDHVTEFYNRGMHKRAGETCLRLEMVVAGDDDEVLRKIGLMR